MSPIKNDWDEAFRKLLEWYRENQESPFIKKFKSDLVGTIYQANDFPEAHFRHALEVLEGTGYLRLFIKGGIETWIKIKGVPDNFEFIDEKDKHYETPAGDDFVEAVKKDLVGTLFDPTDFPGDISFMASVLKFGGYIQRLPNGKWIKIAKLPDDYNYPKEGNKYLESGPDL